jgi:hypothetical protein
VRKEMAFPFKPTLLTILSFEVPADFRVWTAVENPRIAESIPKLEKLFIMYKKETLLMRPEKGCGRFSNFSDAPAGPASVISTYIFLAVNANPTPLDLVIGVYLFIILLFIIGQGSRPLLPIDRRNF